MNTKTAAKTFKVGEKVVALHNIVEGGAGTKGNPDAPFLRDDEADPSYIHAFKGDEGVVEDVGYVEPGTVFVRYTKRGTSTITDVSEVCSLAQSRS
jgi:hypothetical protein